MELSYFYQFFFNISPKTFSETQKYVLILIHTPLLLENNITGLQTKQANIRHYSVKKNNMFTV